MKTAAVILALGLPSLAFATDPLPLKRGVFVDSSVKCSERSNATAVSFWGDELNSAKAVGRIRKVAKNGQSYTVDLEIEHMDGSKEKSIWSLTIRHPESMTITNDFGSWNHRWCSDRM